MVKFRWEKEFKETPIGKIPKDWEVKEIKDMVKIVKDRVEPSGTPNKIFELYSIPAYLEKKYPEITLGKNIKSSKYRVKPPMVLYGRLNPQDPKVWPITETGLYSQITSTEFFPLKIKEPTSFLFVCYLLQTEFIRGMSEAFSTGTTPSRTRLVEADFLKFTIPYPSPEEQRRIATVLSWFDDLIENKRKQNEILEKTAMAIFKSWFIDFEPFQDEEFVYSEELDMEIPKGWEVKLFGEVAKFHDSKRIPLSEIERQNRKGPYPYYGANGIIDYIDDYIFDGLYLLVAEDGTVMDEKGFVVSRLVHGKFWANNHVHVITGRGVSIEYLYLYLKFTPIEPYVTGAVQAKLNQKNFSQMPVLIPPKPILQRFHSLVEPLFQKIILNEKEIMLLKKVRDALLPQLVFGRLRVVET